MIAAERIGYMGMSHGGEMAFRSRRNITASAP